MEKCKLLQLLLMISKYYQKNRLEKMMMDRIARIKWKFNNWKKIINENYRMFNNNTKNKCLKLVINAIKLFMQETKK